MTPLLSFLAGQWRIPVITAAAQFTEPFILPGPPAGLTIPGGLGAVINGFLESEPDNTTKESKAK